MKFVKKEVKGAERLSFVQAGVSDTGAKPKTVKSSRKSDYGDDLPTTAGLFVSDGAKCVFCERQHESRECVKAQGMSLEEKRKIVQNKKCCFVCLRSGHQSKTCKAVIRCIVCGRKHPAVMCPDVHSSKPKKDEKEPETTNSNLACSSSVILKTLMVNVVGKKGSKRVRALIDDGSQRSYILDSVANQLDLDVLGSVGIVHNLFGGVKTQQAQQHHEFNVKIQTGKKLVTIPALGQRRICGDIPRAAKGKWMNQLKNQNIWISDLGSEPEEIGLLIGADAVGKLLTGRIIQLENGFTAIETALGWTLMGQDSDHRQRDSTSMLVTNMSITNSTIDQLWKLETIGIMEPSEHQTKQEKEAEVLNHFMQTVTREADGRYTVSLPWMDGVPKIPDNKLITEKRLESMTRRLKQQDRFEDYDTVINSWLADGIIEEVPDAELSKLCHYLPHRAVFKPGSSTTPVRPAFDASCKSERNPSLNECLEKGPNLLELIMDIILRFRTGKIGIISDIRKAFLMINVIAKDRDFLRFIWWKGPEFKVMMILRHCRVVFGVNCSPFLLGAVIEYHLRNSDPADKIVAEQLRRSLYVDNCVTSVDSVDEYEDFKQKATQLMHDAQIDLRLWKRSSGDGLGVGLRSSKCGLSPGRAEDEEESVLGLQWNTKDDTLRCDMDFEFEAPEKITKRTILSIAHKIFDPIGFVCPVTLFPKKLLQEAWALKTGWDDELPTEISQRFVEWCKGLKALKEIRIPRNCTGMVSSRDSWQLHMFCDASKDAYSGVVFLRTMDQVASVQLLQAKTRVAPLKKTSIPRLELLSCCIGARLLDSVKKALDLEDVPTICWTDSTTALAWICRNDIWGTFVGNRVKEICKLTQSHEWRHVPGHMNPADLPSRGCSAEQLLRSSWWEGPTWLMDENKWPSNTPTVNEEEVAAERKKTVVASHLVVQTIPWYGARFSSFMKNVKMVAWLRRFGTRSKLSGPLTVEELDKAEKTIIKMIQAEAFPNPGSVIGGIKVVRDKEGILCVVSKLLYRDDTTSFRYPAILPNAHPMVDQLIRYTHETHGHNGTQFLMAKLREKYWILQGRRRIKSILAKCVICRRFTSKKVNVVPAPLPENRVKTAQVFEVVGIDLAGPLYLRSKEKAWIVFHLSCMEKAWIVLFTCAVYRCVHFELVKAISTEAFLDALSRFVNRRGRPSVIYTDNGTNFVGTENLFKNLDWQKIQEVTSAQKIKWIFNPPTAAWWGGWWERLVRTMKELLRRILGKAKLTFDKLNTYIIEVESYINGRPLTTVTEDVGDLIALTPAMFLHEIPCSTLEELDFLKSSGYQAAYRERKSVLHEFKIRFRNEYLAQLVQRGKEKPHHSFKVGDVVLIEADNKKRWEWPMGQIVKLIPGRDGHVRTVYVKTANGLLPRPAQRLYPLEISSPEEAPDVHAVVKREVKTRSGRTVKEPSRFGFSN